MKKTKYLFIFTIIYLILPISVFASVSVNPKITCKETMKIGSSTSCSIYADIEGGSVTSINANVCITAPGEANCTMQAFDGFNSHLKDVGSNIEIGTIKISDTIVKKPGVLSISFVLNSGSSSQGDVLFTTTTLNKEIKVLNNDASLSNIAIDSKSIFNALDKTYEYEKEKVQIDAVTSDSKASIVSGTGEIKLACGKGTYEIKTKAEDGTTKIYKININRKCNNDPTLKNIKLTSGALSPIFSSATYDYKVDVSKDIDKIKITPEPTNEKTTYKINNSTSNEVALNYGENTFKIETTAEDNTTKTYTIIINREDGRSSNSYLSDIKLSDGKINFEKTKLTYDIRVLNEVEKITIDAIPEDITSKVEIKGGEKLVVGDNVIKIKVTSETGESNEYTLNIRRLEVGETLGDNPRIKDIKIEGYDLKFNPDIKEYTLKIDKEKTLDILITMEDETSDYKIIGNENLKNKSVISIKTTSLDGTEDTYKIVIKKSNSKTILLVGLFALLIIGISAALVIIKKKEKDPNKVKTKVVKEDKLLSKVDKQLKEIDNKETKQVRNTEQSLEHEDYKICPLCGHKISFELQICPYCKKDFTKSA